MASFLNSIDCLKRCTSEINWKQIIDGVKLNRFISQTIKCVLIIFYQNQRWYEGRPNPSGFLQGRQILVGDYFISGIKHFYHNYQYSLNQLFLYLQA